MKKILYYILSIMVLLTFTCSGKIKKIKIAGSTTVLPIIQAAAEEYVNLHPDTDISVRGGGSSIGILSIINQIIDIGSASRPVNKQEIEMLKNKNRDLIETAIALDAISIIIHPENPVENLTLVQLQKIYSGQIENWLALGGKDQKLVVISRDTPSGSFAVFNEIVLEQKKVRSDALMLASNNAVATNVAVTPGAIGYVGIGYVNEQVKLISISGIKPETESIMNRAYPLTRELFMYTLASTRSLAQEFIDYLLAEQGQQIVEKQGYIRIKPAGLRQ
ncbi:MAG: PstS family phosphate ABC transporter substrate-binding protein [Candidatus Cloacimonetes bacterium]|nr:PstS family phosphate ABC transporter substrate-binding protein [Candidatus Cloacimonadota bacterium]